MLLIFQGQLIDSAHISRASEIDYNIYMVVNGRRILIEDQKDRNAALEVVIRKTTNCSFNSRYSTPERNTIKLTESDRKSLEEIHEMIDDDGKIYLTAKAE